MSLRTLRGESMKLSQHVVGFLAARGLRLVITISGAGNPDGEPRIRELVEFLGGLLPERGLRVVL
jgi:hypothetical protein